MRAVLIRFCLVIFVVIDGPRGYAQCDTLVTPFEPKALHQSWALKGKAAPIPWGDDLALTAVLGVEYGFAKRHSVGIDGFILHTSGRYDAFTDTLGVAHEEGGRRWSTDKALFLNYRYYLGFPAWREKGLVPYVGAFGRVGLITGEGDPEYTSDRIEYREEHVSAGPLVGMVCLFKPGRRWGLDANVGVFRKHVDATEVDIVLGQRVTVPYTSDYTGLRIGFNVYYWFCRG